VLPGCSSDRGKPGLRPKHDWGAHIPEPLYQADTENVIVVRLSKRLAAERTVAQNAARERSSIARGDIGLGRSNGGTGTRRRGRPNAVPTIRRNVRNSECHGDHDGIGVSRGRRRGLRGDSPVYGDRLI
jgi:hypothetical protein